MSAMITLDAGHFFGNFFIKPCSSSSSMSSSDEELENKSNLVPKSDHEDWFDNDETNSDTSLDDVQVESLVLNGAFKGSFI